MRQLGKALGSRAASLKQTIAKPKFVGGRLYIKGKPQKPFPKGTGGEVQRAMRGGGVPQWEGARGFNKPRTGLSLESLERSKQAARSSLISKRGKV